MATMQGKVKDVVDSDETCDVRPGPTAFGAGSVGMYRLRKMQ